MLISRRDFMHRIAVFSAVGMAPRFLTAAASEEVNAIEGFKDDRVLVVVQLGGGNDGLNTVVPHGLDDYYRARGPTSACVAMTSSSSTTNSPSTAASRISCAFTTTAS
jgi:uncharacterized protein (DUF1501 family)